MRMRWGSVVSPALEILAVPSASQIHVHPGSDVFIEFLGALNERVWIAISPKIEDR